MYPTTTTKSYHHQHNHHVVDIDVLHKHYSPIRSPRSSTSPKPNRAKSNDSQTHETLQSVSLILNKLKNFERNYKPTTSQNNKLIKSFPSSLLQQHQHFQQPQQQAQPQQQYKYSNVSSIEEENARLKQELNSLNDELSVKYNISPTRTSPRVISTSPRNFNQQLEVEHQRPVTIKSSGINRFNEPIDYQHSPPDRIQQQQQQQQQSLLLKTMNDRSERIHGVLDRFRERRGNGSKVERELETHLRSISSPYTSSTSYHITADDEKPITSTTHNNRVTCTENRSALNNKNSYAAKYAERKNPTTTTTTTSTSSYNSNNSNNMNSVSNGVGERTAIASSTIAAARLNRDLKKQSKTNQLPQHTMVDENVFILSQQQQQQHCPMSSSEEEGYSSSSDIQQRSPQSIEADIHLIERLERFRNLKRQRKLNEIQSEDEQLQQQQSQQFTTRSVSSSSPPIPTFNHLVFNESIATHRDVPEKDSSLKKESNAMNQLDLSGISAISSSNSSSDSEEEEKKRRKMKHSTTQQQEQQEQQQQQQQQLLNTELIEGLKTQNSNLLSELARMNHEKSVVEKEQLLTRNEVNRLKEEYKLLKDVIKQLEKDKELAKKRIDFLENEVDKLETDAIKSLEKKEESIGEIVLGGHFTIDQIRVNSNDNGDIELYIGDKDMILLDDYVNREDDNE